MGGFTAKEPSAAGDWLAGTGAAAGAGPQVSCSNCNATFAAGDARCPYCGALNPLGAEQAYMAELDGIKRGTEDLAQEAQRGFAAGLSRNAKRAVIIIAAVLALIAVSFLVYNLADSNEERRAVESYQARETFRQEHFAEIERLYESGDDAAMGSYIWSLAQEPGYDAIYSWEHYGFLEVYDDYDLLNMFISDTRGNPAGIDDYVWSVAVALRLAGIDDKGVEAPSALPEADEERATPYREFGWRYLEDTLQMDSSEIAAFADATRDEFGYIQRDELEQALKPRLRQLGIIG